MKLFKLISVVILLLTTSQAFAKYSYPNAGYDISIEKPAKIDLKAGEQTTLEGSICVKRVLGFSGKYYCQNTKDEKIDLQFYFPDEAHKLDPADVTITKAGKEINFSYTTPELKEEDENRFIVIVGSIKSKTQKLLAIRAKIEKRITRIELIRDKYIEYGSHEKVVELFNKFIERLKAVVARIEKALSYEPDILASVHYPLQVNNKQSAALIKTTMFGGFKMFLKVLSGSAIEGEKAEIDTALVNMNEHVYAAPGMHMGWTDFFKIGSQFKIKYEFNGKLVHETEAGQIPLGEAKEYGFFTEKLNPADANDLKVSLVMTRKGWGHFFQLGWGQVSQFIPVADDKVNPQWMEPIEPQESLEYAQQFPKVVANTKDLFGKIDKETLSAVLTSVYPNGLQEQEDVTSLLSIEGDGREYKLELNLVQQPEATHTISISGKDYAGNPILENPLERTVTVDRTAPEITVSTLGDVLTNEPAFNIYASVYDDNPTEVILLHNGWEVHRTMSDELDLQVILEEGANYFEIQAVDGAGNEAIPAQIFNVVLDTIPPQLSNIIPIDGDRIYTLDFNISGESDEDLSSLKINGHGYNFSGRNWNTTYHAQAEGDLTLSYEATDLAGNSSMVQTNHEIVLKVLNEDLITISPAAQGTNLIVKGAIGAARPGVTVNVRAGFFNQKDVIAAGDGSFSAELAFFNSVTLSATDDLIGRTDSVTLKYNVDTTLSGVVKDINKNPLPGVTVMIASSGQSSVTDGSGVFKIPDAATGDQRLLIDGSTIPEEVTGPDKSFSMTSITINVGVTQSNVLQTPIYLAPLLNDGTETDVAEGEGAVVTSDHAPGAAIDIPAGVTTFPGGGSSGKINMIEIDSDVTSIPPLSYAVPDTVIALEPSGLTFSEPVELTLPNVNEFPPGMQVVIFSKNSDKGIWEIDGIATVDESGANIVTKEGMGITHFSEVYAAPLGPKISEVGAKDKPGADTFNGAVTSQIVMPSYKSLGQDIAPSLIYKSTWAKPTAVVSNIFDIPRNEAKFYAAGGERSFVVDIDVEVEQTVWVEPNYILAQFLSGDFKSEKMRFEGMPNRSVISYAMDLSELDSGLFPYTSKYEVHLKHMIITVTKQTVDPVIGETRVTQKTKKETQEIEQAFPQSISGPLFVQNKQRSPAGSGWKIAGAQRIYNLSSPRLMIEEANGDVGSYVINDVIDTIYTHTDDKGIMKASDLSSWPIVTFSDDQRVYQYDFDEGASKLFDQELPKYSGIFGLRGHWKAGEDRWWFIMKQKYSMYRQPAHSVALDNNSFVLTDKLSSIFEYIDNVYTQILGADSIPAPRHTMNERECTKKFPFVSGGRLPGPFNCWHPSCEDKGGTAACGTAYSFHLTLDLYNSTGIYPTSGYLDGNLDEAQFNNPMGISRGPGATFVVADSGNNVVRLVDKALGTVTTIAGNGQTYDNGDGEYATNASMYHPRGVVYDSVGNLYITTEKGFIRKVDTLGRISTYAGKLEGSLADEVHAENMLLDHPYGMIIDNENNYLYVADTGHHRIVRIDMNTKMATTVAGNYSCTPATQDIGDGRGALGASLCSPEFVGLDENKNLLIADSGHNRIRRVTFNYSESGEISYTSINTDQSSIKRNADGTYERTYRTGSKVFFDSKGLQSRTINRKGHETFIDYDDQDRLTRMTDAAGRDIQYVYDGDNLSQIIDPAGRITRFYYSFDNELEEVIYPDDTGKQFSYQDGMLIEEKNQRGFATNFYYNEWKRLAEVSREDDDGNVISVTIQDSSSASVGNNYTGEEGKDLQSYGDGGLVETVSDANKASTTFAKSPEGYIQYIIDAEDKKTEIKRDIYGQPLEIIKHDETYATFKYDPDTLDLLEKFDSASGLLTKATFDQYGYLLTQTKEVEGGKSFTKYNFFNEVTGDLTEEVDIAGVSTKYEYNGKFGLQSSIIDANDNRVETVYDDFGNIEKISFPGGNIVTYSTDDAGNVISKTNGEDQTTQYEYDLFNRVIAVVNPKKDRTEYFYTKTGKLDKIIDPYGGTYFFNYDRLDRLIKKTNPLGKITTLKYDPNGNVIREVDPNDNIKTYEYDISNRLIKKTLPDNIYNIAYDNRGNMTSISNNDSEVTFGYREFEDEDLLLSVESKGLGLFSDMPLNSLSYDYDAFGQMIELKSPLGDVRYRYNDQNRLDKLINHKDEIFDFAYDSIGRLKKLYRPGSHSQYEFDDSSFVTRIAHNVGHSSSGSLIAEYIYQRDNIGNRTKKRTPAGDNDFGYDKNNQLTTATNPEASDSHSSESFSYDDLGNRTLDQLGSYSFDPRKQQLVEDYQFLYVYDHNGNLTSKQSKGLTGDVTNYIYSSENQLIGVKVYKNNVLIKEVSYGYSALGQRMEKAIIDHEDSAQSFTRRFIYNGESILAQYDEDNRLLASYTHSPFGMDDILAVNVTTDGVLAGVSKNSGSLFYIKDAIGNVNSIVDGTGSKVQHHVYSAFGKLLKVEDGNGNDVTDAPVLDPYFTFTGREFDKETGLYYFRARMYDSNIGRFLQVDPDPGQIVVPITMTNRYVYAGNNPSNIVDPSGEGWFGDLLAGIGIGILAAFTGGAAAALVVGQLGIQGSIVGAIVGAAVGASVGAITGGVAGGLYYEATGRNFSDGFKFGAAIGAIAGGLSGAKAGFKTAKLNTAKADLIKNAPKSAFWGYVCAGAVALIAWYVWRNKYKAGTVEDGQIEDKMDTLQDQIKETGDGTSLYSPSGGNRCEGSVAGAGVIG